MAYRALSDAEWDEIAWLLPEPSHLGHQPAHNERDILNAIFMSYIQAITGENCWDFWISNMAKCCDIGLSMKSLKNKKVSRTQQANQL